MLSSNSQKPTSLIETHMIMGFEKSLHHFDLSDALLTQQAGLTGDIKRRPPNLK